MLRRTAAIATIVALPLMGAPLPVLAQAQGAGSITGTATGPSGEILPNISVQVRDLATNQIVGTGTTNAQGVFSVTGLNPGQFVVEMVSAQGAIVGTTTTITLTTGAMAVTGVAVTATAAGVIAGGAIAVGGGLGGFFGTTLGIITGVVVGGAITTAAVIANQPEASPSR